MQLTSMLGPASLHAEIIAPMRNSVLVFDYFGTPTNRAPVNLPSSPMSGA